MSISEVIIEEIEQDDVDLCGYDEKFEEEFSYKLNLETLSYENGLVYMLVEEFTGQEGNPILIDNEVVGLQC